MWSVKECHSIVARYNKKVKLYPKRKRGNPPDVLKAMKIIRNMQNKTWCECCGKVGPVQLHHLNGWRDYRTDKLIFLCRQCHLNYHREERMANRNRYRWTDAEISKLRNMVDTIMKKENLTKGKTFEMVAKRMNIKPNWVQKIYYGAIHENSSQSKAKMNNTKNINIANSVMTRDEAISFWHDMKRWGITVN